MSRPKPPCDISPTQPKSQLRKTLVVSCGSLNMDMLRRRVEIDGETLHLSPREFSVLYLLLCGGSTYVTQTALIRAIETQENPKALPSIVSRLRSRLRPYGYRIATARGAGYRLEKVVPLDTTW